MAAADQRRSGDFLERLSFWVLTGSYFGGFIVLLDPKFTLVVIGQTVQIGSGFAPEVKGMVLQSMLISGLAAVISFWFNTTKQGQDQAKSMSRIAEAAPSVAAAVVAAAVPNMPAVTPAPMNPETGNIPAAEAAKTTEDKP